MSRRCLLPGAASRQRHKGAFLGMRLGRAHPRVECAERHHPARRGIVEATALDAAHVQVTLVHKRLNEQGERLAARPERGIGARFHYKNQTGLTASCGQDCYSPTTPFVDCIASLRSACTPSLKRTG